MESGMNLEKTIQMEEEIKMKYAMKYREHFSEITEIAEKDDIGTEHLPRIIEIIKNTDHYMQEITNNKGIVCPDIANLDAKVVSCASKLIKKVAQSLGSSLMEFHYSEFVDKLNSYCSQNGKNDTINYTKWDSLSDKISNILFCSPTFTCVYGSFPIEDAEDIPKKPRQRREKQVESLKKKPENVKEVKNEDESVQKTMNYIMKVLNAQCKAKDQAVPFFEFVLNHDDYSETIFNIYNLSQLVKDNYVEMFEDEEMLFIRPVPKNIANERRSTNEARSHMVFSIGKDEWQVMKEDFPRREPIIKPFPNSQKKSRRV